MDSDLSAADADWLRSLPQRVSYHPRTGTDDAMRARLTRLMRGRLIRVQVLDFDRPGMAGVTHAEVSLTDLGRTVLAALPAPCSLRPRQR